MSEPDETRTRAEQIAESIKEQMERDENSRRRFLSRSAMAGTVLALGGGTGFVLAQDDGDDDDDDGEGNGTAAEEMTASFDDIEGTDLDVLNYALTLEHLENAFYREGLETFSQADFDDSEAIGDYTPGSDQTVYGHLEVIGEHEASHVEVLSEAVTLLGGEPAQEASYAFELDSVERFLTLAQVFENTGVAAYAGAAPFIESPDLLGAALSIHSVEARHAAFLNDVTGQSGFPNAYDPASSQQEVLDAVGPFVETDDGTPTPTPTPNGTATPTPNGTATPTPNGTDTPMGTDTPDDDT